MTDLNDRRQEGRRVLSRADYEALPEPHGAWWRAYFARLEKGYEQFEREFGMGSAEKAMLSIFPQPHGAYTDELREMNQDEIVRLIHGDYCIDEDKG